MKIKYKATYTTTRFRFCVEGYDTPEEARNTMVGVIKSTPEANLDEDKIIVEEVK